MSISDELITGFAVANFQINNQIVDKCTKLCLTYNLTAEQFVDQFLAYTLSYLDGAPPNLENLDKLERSELQKLGKRQRAKSPKIETTTTTTTPKTPARNNRTTVQNDENTPSKQYSQRSDSRTTLCQFGEFRYQQYECGKSVADVRVQEMPACIRYMYEKPGTRAMILNNLTWRICDEICKEQQLELTPHPLKEYTGEVVVAGRIYADSDQLDQHSAILEGTLEINRGFTIKLELNNIDKLALFNGQVAVIEGNNTKHSLVVKKIHTGSIQSIENHPKLAEPIRIMVACGPFTLPDNLTYQPLKDLIGCAIETKPNVLILIGPFLDRSHTLFESLLETFDDFFHNLLEQLIANIPETIKIVLVASNRDIHNHIIYPTPPYKLPFTRANVMVSADPACIDIDGIQIGATSIDILFDLNKEEYFKDLQKRSPNDRMSRLITHLFQQKSFYPIHTNRNRLSIDYQLFENYGVLERVPHLLILPSTFKNFIKSVNGCIVVNPERLIKGNVAGTFTQIEIQPGDGAICERVACQVVRD